MKDISQKDIVIQRFPPMAIMVPVDGSENSKRAAEVAIRLAKDYGSMVILEHAMPMPIIMMESPVDVGVAIDYDQYYGTLESEASKWLDPIASEAGREGLKCKIELDRSVGSLVDTILEKATNEEIDLIVIGTRGLSGLKKMLMGSVSSGVVAHAHCSVLVVR